eukprot:1114414-Pyramimonas_sp.AAC.1
MSAPCQPHVSAMSALRAAPAARRKLPARPSRAPTCAASAPCQRHVSAKSGPRHGNGRPNEGALVAVGWDGPQLGADGSELSGRHGHFGGPPRHPRLIGQLRAELPLVEPPSGPHLLRQFLPLRAHLRA